MLTRTRIISALTGLLLTGSLVQPAVAQQSPPASPALESVPRPCGTDEAMRQALGASYDQWWQNYRSELQQTALSRPPGSPPAGPRLIVPVVVHIIHTGGSDNISDAQVEDAIRITNEVFQELDPDTAQVIPYFKPRIGNANIEFRLARLDPNGNCTTGITRHFSSLTNSAGENVKDLPGARWTPQRYLNVWVVEQIASGAAGYSYLPCGVGPTFEGIVILNTYFGSIGRTPNIQYNRHAFPHEVGHYLGLPHTWGGTNTPQLPTNCQDDDGISDTPNTTGYSFVCNLASPSCPGDPDPLSNVQNVMDYAGCPSMFTQGQALVMNQGIVSRFACRSQLSTAQTHLLTGVADNQVIPPCAPVASITVQSLPADGNPLRICAGEDVQFEGNAYNLPAGSVAQYQWSFPGGTPSTSTQQSPTVTYSTAGLYSASLTVSNPAGSDIDTKTNAIRVGTLTGGYTAPLAYGFEQPSFPVDPVDSLRNWEIFPATGTRWEYTNVAAAEGTGSVRLRLRSSPGGIEHALTSPNIIIPANLDRLSLSIDFQNAYAPANSASTDRLTVAYSTNCGRTWTNRGVRNTAALTTAPATTALFVPTARQWRNQTVALGAFPANTPLMIRFLVESGRGSVIYLDSIRLRTTVPTGLAEIERANSVSLTVVPNPSGGEATLRLVPGSAVRGTTTIRVYDATGRLIGQPWQAPTTVPTSGAHEVALRTVAGRTLQAGVYVVEVTTADGTRQTQRALIY